jgi:hypothetical protein
MINKKLLEVVNIILKDAKAEEAKGDYFLEQGKSFSPKGKEHCRIAANCHYKLALDLYRDIGENAAAARVAAKMGNVELIKRTA